MLVPKAAFHRMLGVLPEKEAEPESDAVIVH
jgi:hypothetical protein